jgi:EAL domain-containing protein (putative c-di-GMP-specific phosphodiesterase class I)/GGDEF domain-containing protein
MSLYKQLWLAIVFLLTVVFGGSLIVTSLSAKSYLEQQLTIKNADNANSLALALTQQGADEVLLELTLAAQFDTGFYELIELTNARGEVVIRREDRQPIDEAPGWFVSLLPIEAEPGVASVQQGWQQMGSIILRSHTRFAYRELWKSTQKMTIVFLVSMLAAGLLGTYLLGIILRPLGDLVTQAKAIGERRFITIPEPVTLEFRTVAKSMNALSGRIKQMLGQEAARLSQWQSAAHTDKISGLMNREPFLQVLDATLKNDDVNSTGSLSLIRIDGLAQLNQLYGRKAVDALLKDIGSALKGVAVQHSGWSASRMNGSDFALLAPRAMEAGDAARVAKAAMHELLLNHSMDNGVNLPAAATLYAHDETVGELLTRLDGALLLASGEMESAVSIAYRDDIQMRPVRQQMEDWRNILLKGFSEKKYSLNNYPVIDLDGNLLHFEAPVRLAWEGELLPAGRFLPWINRLELSADLDKHVLGLALQLIETEQREICVNMSVASLVEPGFLAWFGELLSVHPVAAKKLWVEVPEQLVFRHLVSFKKLCAKAKSFQSRVGIEHMGHQLSELGRLHDVGLDYVKIDASFVRDIDSNTGNQTLFRTLCTLGHSIGLLVIAEGVQTDAEWAMLKELGADGATGPGIYIQ